MPAGTARLGCQTRHRKAGLRSCLWGQSPWRGFGGSWCQPLLSLPQQPQDSGLRPESWKGRGHGEGRVLERERAWAAGPVPQGSLESANTGAFLCQPVQEPGGAQLPHPGFPVHREGTSLARNSPGSRCRPSACSKWKEEESNVLLTVLRNAGNEWESLVARVCFFDCVRLDHVGGELWILRIIRKTTQF